MSRIPQAVRLAVYARDQGCIGPRIGMPNPCKGWVELDHIRASGALGMKSESTIGNLATLCSLEHHPQKTNDPRTWRPKELEYIAETEGKLT
jgi:hypothetical protein